MDLLSRNKIDFKKIMVSSFIGGMILIIFANYFQNPFVSMGLTQGPVINSSNPGLFGLPALQSLFVTGAIIGFMCEFLAQKINW